MEPDLELYFAENSTPKFIFGRNCRAYWVNPLLQRSWSEYSELFEELHGQPVKCYEYYRKTQSTHSQSIIMKETLNKIFRNVLIQENKVNVTRSIRANIHWFWWNLLRVGSYKFVLCGRFRSVFMTRVVLCWTLSANTEKLFCRARLKLVRFCGPNRCRNALLPPHPRAVGFWT
jgi:hypothetical protein